MTGAGKIARWIYMPPLRATRVWLRVDADFLTEQAHFSVSTNGVRWTPLGRPFTMAFQLKTFQGVRFALFHYNEEGARGGVADVDLMRVDEPNPRGLMQPIPFGRTIASGVQCARIARIAKKWA